MSAQRWRLFSQHGQDIYVYAHYFKHHAAPCTYVDIGAQEASVLSVENSADDPEIGAVLRAAGYWLAHVFSTFEELYTREAPSARELLGF